MIFNLKTEKKALLVIRNKKRYNFPQNAKIQIFSSKYAVV